MERFRLYTYTMGNEPTPYYMWFKRMSSPPLSTERYRNTNTQPEINKTRKKEKPLTNPPVFWYPARSVFFCACSLPSTFTKSHLMPAIFVRQETDSHHKRCPVQDPIADPHGTPGHAWAWVEIAAFPQDGGSMSPQKSLNARHPFFACERVLLEIRQNLPVQ